MQKQKFKLDKFNCDGQRLKPNTAEFKRYINTKVATQLQSLPQYDEEPITLHEIAHYCTQDSDYVRPVVPK